MVTTLPDLVLNINLNQSCKCNRLVVETYEGSIPHLKSKQYSGPLRNVNINGIESVDNLSDCDLERVRDYLNRPTNVQIKKYQYILGKSNLFDLSSLAVLGCLFYEQSKKPMYQVEEVVFSELITDDAVKLQGVTVWGERTHLFLAVGVEDDESVSSEAFAKAYVDIKGKDHCLQLVFCYDGWDVKYTPCVEHANNFGIIRDYAFETQILSSLKQCGWVRDSKSSFVYTGKDFQKDLLSLLDKGIIVFTESEKRVKKGDFSNIRVSYEIDWFDIRGKVLIDDVEIDITELLNLDSDGSQWVEFKGFVVAIPQTLQSTEIATGDGDGLRISKKRIANAVDIARELNGGSVIGLEKIVDYQDIDLAISDQILGTLRPYQMVGVKWLLSLKQNHFGGCLADDMGLGKTLQVIAYLSDCSMNETLNLIIVPKTLLMNWEKEFEKFSPQTSVVIYHGAHRSISEAIACKVVITTYGTLLSDIELFSKIGFTNVIIDEAQHIKNPKSLIHAAVKTINAETKIILTGTPVENNIREFWGLMRLINPDLFDYVDPFKNGFDSDETLERIRAITHPFLLRRMKEEVLTDLPEKRSQVLYCVMEDAQQLLYDKMLASIQYDLEREGDRFRIKTNSTMLRGLLFLQEICCHPALLHDAFNPEHCIDSAKLDLLMEILDELRSAGHKTVVFSRFTRMLRIIETQLIKQHYNYFYLDGSTANRLDVVDEFERSKTGVFLISLKAGGTGLNLVSADTVILYDPWWNPAVERQAEDRVYRIGQTQSVMIYRLLVAGTIEEKIQKLQQAKNELYDQLLSDHELPTSITANEMWELLMEQ